ncbi:hypothetical protein T440DRAFT_204117 [Plenodomus tracheiphilus IPT5]|uniref:Uncharacterized protein n=1 Tax=Plenodomus tracheiphilus IPT5 TaxID=1408161 RepID=A0A6A7BIA5_9PLEO|nr:hypothetical protein T440DRAFT_204117 [Plenodomus tracheiphilus IPT5]
MYKKRNRNRVHGSLHRGAISHNRTCRYRRRLNEGDPLHRNSFQIKHTDGIRTSSSSWGRRSGRDRAACSGSRHAQTMSPGGSRATSGRPHRLSKVSIIFDMIMAVSEIAYSCSTFGPGCSHGSCGQSHRTSSRWSGEHRHIHPDRRRNLHGRRRIHPAAGRRSLRPGSSCGQCDPVGRTCSTLGHRNRRHGHPSGHRHPWCTRGRCGRYHRSGSRSSQPGERCTRG